jgi:hypothetical protein
MKEPGEVALFFCCAFAGQVSPALMRQNVYYRDTVFLLRTANPHYSTCRPPKKVHEIYKSFIYKHLTVIFIYDHYMA